MGPLARSLGEVCSNIHQIRDGKLVPSVGAMIHRWNLLSLAWQPSAEVYGLVAHLKTLSPHDQPVRFRHHVALVDSEKHGQRQWQ